MKLRLIDKPKTLHFFNLQKHEYVKIFMLLWLYLGCFFGLVMTTAAKNAFFFTIFAW